MKTYETVKFNKGFYLVTRYCGRTLENKFCKSQRELNARIKELKAAGYVENGN